MLHKFLGGGVAHKSHPHNERIFLYENVRFILIVLVVVGHAIDLNTAQSKVYKSLFLWIYSFHMPLFLFLSGLFHKNKNITAKVLEYICIGFLWKIVYFIEKMLIYGAMSLS